MTLRSLVRREVMPIQVGWREDYAARTAFLVVEDFVIAQDRVEAFGVVARTVEDMGDKAENRDRALPDRALPDRVGSELWRF